MNFGAIFTPTVGVQVVALVTQSAGFEKYLNVRYLNPLGLCGLCLETFPTKLQVTGLRFTVEG